MDFAKLLHALAEKISGGTDTSMDGLRKILISDVNEALIEVRGPAEELGLDMVKAILFGAAVDYIKFDEMTDEQVAQMVPCESLNREMVLAAHAAQMAVVAQAEREYQENAAAVRQAAMDLVKSLAIKVGKFGLGLLASSLA